MRKTKKNAESSGNSSLGASCGDLADFGHCADFSLALRPKSAKNSTTSTAIRRICERSEATNTRIFDFQKADSAKKNNSSLRADSQNLRGNPPIEKGTELQNRLPRFAKGKSRNDNLGKSAESSKKSACESLKKSLDSAPSFQKLADLDALQKNIKYYFKDENLLRTALTHKSFDKHTNNERLEFLGDAVMDLIIGEYVFRTQERGNEGDLTRIRAAMVNENSLANLANNINLGKYLFISFSESRNKGRKKPSILSDAFEALMGAIYLDGGLESARNVAHLVLEKQYKEVEIESLFVDYKSALQELTQAICGNLPKYVLLKSSGPDHSKKFTMQVLINGEEFATARGKSKKEAEQICAKIAYNRIKKERL